MVNLVSQIHDPEINHMKSLKTSSGILAAIVILILASCSSPITVTGVKNTSDNTKISSIVIMPMFENPEFIKQFEQEFTSFFNSKDLKCKGSLEFLNPGVKYSINDVKAKCDSLGADAILVIIYLGTDKTDRYVPQTTDVSGTFGGYWGGGFWGDGFYGDGAYTGGHWETNSTVNLNASVYVHSSKDPLWSAGIRISNPRRADETAYYLSRYFYSEWEKNKMLR
jgi:hypothetical protein